MGIAVALVGMIAAIAIGRATGAGWLPAIGPAVILGVGLYLWERDDDKGWGDLGEGLMVGVIVAIALMAVQRDADERSQAATDRRDRQVREAEMARQEAAQRANLQLSLTMQTDLRGIALAGRDLSGFFLAGKNFAGADLHDANLERADLRGGRFRRAILLGANLDRTRMARVDLRQANLSSEYQAEPEDLAFDPGPNLASATLRAADLTDADLRDAVLPGVDLTGARLLGADLRGALAWPADEAPTRFQRALLIFADLSGAELAEADLRKAILGGAQFCNAHGLGRANLKGALYDRTTRWPPGFDPGSHGALEAGGDAARSAPDQTGYIVFGGDPARPCRR